MGVGRRWGWILGLLVLMVVLASCAQPGSPSTLGVQALPPRHGNPLGIHPAGSHSAPVCPGPLAAGSAACTSRVVTDKHGKPVSQSAPGGYYPFQLRTYYGVSASYASGSGPSIAIVDAYDDPTAATDLATFEKQFPATFASDASNACTLTKLNQQGVQGAYPKVDSGWALEISLDVQWACAMAPGADIVLVEANSSSLSDLLAAVAVASQRAPVVSMSWGGSESSSELASDTAFQVSNVTFTASSGDNGTGVIYPAASPYVVGVGGTTLPLDSSGKLVSGGSETAWTGSGGGISVYEPAPGYQVKLSGSANAGSSLPASNRGVPDVAYDADPSTGVAVYDSTAYQGTAGWFVVGGTSAGSPQWAALVAVADAGRAAPLGSGSTATSPLYGLAASGYAADFHDIISGNDCSSGPKHGPHASSGGSGVCQTTAGYDFVTGLGSPVANALVPALASY